MTKNGPRSQPTPLTRAVAQLLKQKIEDAGTNRSRLADRLDGKVRRSHLYNLLAGDRPIDLAELEIVCAELGVSYLEVVRDAEVASMSQGEATEAG